jgi:hypothetical protein
MKLSLAIALILVELGAGVLLLMPLVPIHEVKKSFFTFHGMLAAVCFAIAAGVYHSVMNSTPAMAGLLAATAICVASFGAAHMEKNTLLRGLHTLGALVAISFGLVAPICGMANHMRAVQGTDVITSLLVVCWVVSALLGGLLLGNVHNAMALGHWYLISRNLSFGYLIRITKVLLAVLSVRTCFLISVLIAIPHIAPLHGQSYLSQLFSVNGNLMFFLMRIMWGLALPVVLAVMSWRCAVGKANQAATGLLYLCEVSVLFGELFAAYLMV